MPIGTTPLNDGNHIPNLAFGTGSALSGKDAQDAVAAALKAGFRHLDTAQAYRNEGSVGAALGEWLGDGESVGCQLGDGLLVPVVRLDAVDKRMARRGREGVWVTTKYSGGDKGPLQELKDSLDRLHLDYVDLYLVHHPRAVYGNLEGAWREMEQARESGLARSIGVSNFDATQLYELLQVAKVKPAVNQIRLHPYIYQSNLATLKFCHDNGIVVEAYGSLFPITQLPNGPVTAALKGPSKRLEASPGQVLFLWVRAKGAVVVTTTSREGRLKEYIGIGDLGSLTEEEVKAIDDAAIPILRNSTVLHDLPSTEKEKASEVALLDLERGQQITLLGEHHKEPRLGLRLIVYSSVILSVHCLQKAAQYFGPRWAVTGTATLSIVTDVICLILWCRELWNSTQTMRSLVD